jgi:hypothetical protein
MTHVMFWDYPQGEKYRDPGNTKVCRCGARFQVRSWNAKVCQSCRDERNRRSGVKRRKVRYGVCGV